jgi:hypothetical protein
MQEVNTAACQQYDQMVKYATAVRLGTAETEAILRRFARNNVQHPTYRAFAELGKAVKTVFLCRYLHSEELRREIQEGLNVIEQSPGGQDGLRKATDSFPSAGTASPVSRIEGLKIRASRKRGASTSQ